jgi:hypothetical protein
MKLNKETLYQKCLDDAIDMMNDFGLEPKSAFKQSATDNNIPFGEEMGSFVDWANDQLFNN